MSRHLHLDLVGGIAGDMAVAALVDVGADWGRLRDALQASGLPLTRIRHERTWRGGLAGARFHVEPERDPPARDWRTIREMLAAARLTTRARDRALDVFERLAIAEATTHGCSPDDVHFHEVGAMDSIVDIVGAAVALDLLDVESASCGSIPICPGQASMAHGVMPLPAPATARLLVGFTLQPVPGALETVTPTGAAILASLCKPDSSLPPMRLLGSGVGMGAGELPDRPNVLRVLLGEVARGTAERAPSSAVVIEASIDDMDPRIYGDLGARLFEAGALDVALIPQQMKKGRPGTLVQVLSRPEMETVLCEVLLRQSTTLGVRSHDVRRIELERRHERVQTRWGDVRLKVGMLGGEVLNVAPEFDDCLAVARAAGVPVKDVLAAAAGRAGEVVQDGRA